MRLGRESIDRNECLYKLEAQDRWRWQRSQFWMRISYSALKAYAEMTKQHLACSWFVFWYNTAVNIRCAHHRMPKCVSICIYPSIYTYICLYDMYVHVYLHNMQDTKNVLQTCEGPRALVSRSSTNWPRKLANRRWAATRIVASLGRNLTTNYIPSQTSCGNRCPPNPWPNASRIHYCDNRRIARANVRGGPRTPFTSFRNE